MLYIQNFQSNKNEKYYPVLVNDFGNYIKFITFDVKVLTRLASMSYKDIKSYLAENPLGKIEIKNIGG